MVKSIAVKEQRIPGFHRTMHEFHSLQRFGNPLGIRAGLIPELSMVDPSHLMRSFDYLQTPVFPRLGGNRNEAGGHKWKKTAIPVPVSIVLVPLPGPAGQRVFYTHF